MQIPFWKSNGLRVAVGTAISGVFLILAVKDVPLEDVAQTLGRVNLAWVALGIAAVLLQSFLRASRWIWLYHPLHKGLRVWHMFEIVVISQMLNIVSPWRIGELARIFLASEIEKRSKTQTVATLGTEKIFDTFMLLLVLLIIPLFMTLPIWLERPREGLVIASVALSIGALGVIVFRAPLIKLSSRFSLPWTRRSLDTHAELMLGSFDVFKRVDIHLWLQALSIVMYFLGIAINYCALLAIDLPLPFVSAFLLFAVLQVGGLVPSSPGKVGVFQALCILGLSLFGVDKSIGLSYGILLYLIAYAPPVLLGVLFLWWTGVSLKRVAASNASNASDAGGTS